MANVDINVNVSLVFLVVPETRPRLYCISTAFYALPRGYDELNLLVRRFRLQQYRHQA